jgi:hypothetical protein
MQRHDIVGIGLAQELSPFTHPGTRHTQRSGQFLMGPLGMTLDEPAQGGSLGDEIGFREQTNPSSPS